MGLWQELNRRMTMEIAIFYRDIYDLLGAKVITTYNQIHYGLYSNKDYGNVRGLEIKYEYSKNNHTCFCKFRSNWLNFFGIDNWNRLAALSLFVVYQG